MTNMADLATITLMTNISYNEKNQTRTEEYINKLIHKEKRELKRDVKFYKLRILQIMKVLLRNKSKEFDELKEKISEKTMSSFDRFISNLIEDLKVYDTKDIIKEMNGNDENEDIVDVEEFDSIEDNEISKIIDKVNLKMSNYNSNKEQPTLDNLVKKTINKDIKVGKKNIKNMKEEALKEIPKMRIDLKDPKLKRKDLEK